jgi:HEAT repeat protein
VTRRSSSVATVLTLVGAVALVNAQDRRPQSQPPSRAGAPVIAADEGRLTARVRNLALGTVLAEVAAQTAIAIVAAPEIEQDPVSADLRALPLDRALRELLKEYDTFFFYGSSANAPAELRGLWIYPKGAASMLQPVAPEAWASSHELKGLLAQSNATIREQTYEALMSRPDAESQDVVMKALRGTSEFDPALRQRLLSSAISKGVMFPPDLLPLMAAADDSEVIRLMALDALATAADMKHVFQAALSDPSEAVRDRAAQILAQIGSGDGGGRPESPARSH